jgi:hypothetical protein
MRPFVDSIQDLKDNREEIISEIKKTLGYENQEATEVRVTEVMKQVAHIVTASNYKELDYDVYETIEQAVKVTSVFSEIMVDMGSINRADAMANLPSSLR